MKLRMTKVWQRKIYLALAVTLFLLALSPARLSAQSVQRLFSTPEIRAELDRLRFQIATGVVVEEPVMEEPVVEPPFSADDDAEDVVYILGGTMRRADGSYTVWLNNIAYDQTNLPPDMELLAPYDRGQLVIRDADSGTSYNVKPGQVLNLSTGQLFESYQYQAVLAAAAAEAARLAVQEASLSGSETGSVILDSAPVETVLEAAQDL